MNEITDFHDFEREQTKAKRGHAMLHENFYEDSQNLFVGACAPRSHFVPFNNAADALKRTVQSSQIINLNGDWRVQIFDDISNIGDDVLTTNYSLIPLKNTTVPGHLNDERFAPHYDTEYPFGLDLPHIFGINPAAAYFKDFEIENDFTAHKKYLTLEGVGCAYIYINGEFAGFTKHRRAFAEFDITNFCALGTNRITIVVLKWSDADYHQCQDIINLYGIFGNVSILCRPRGHLSDVKIESTLSDDLSNATVEINIDALIADEAKISLYSPEGTFLSSSGVDSTGFSQFNIVSPLIYSAETPDLYTILIEYHGEFITFKTGIRAIEIDDGVFKINRRAVKLKGVNWQLIDAKNGYSLTETDMQTVLLKLKRCNLNAIKFAEVPPVKLLQLCTELGFYVMCGNGLDMTHMRHSANPSSLHVMADVFGKISTRAYENFKNCSGVIVWDLGKNLGFGKIIEDCAANLRERDKSRPIFYYDIEDDTISDFKTNFCENTGEITFDGEDNRPVLISNCSENLAEIYKKIYEEDRNAGAFYDSLHAQATSFSYRQFTKQSLISSGKILNENPLLDVNYEPLPMYREQKFLAAPLTIEPLNLYEGSFNVTSRYDFIYLSRLQGEFELTSGSHVLQKEQIGVLATPPRRSQQINLNLNLPPDEDTHLRITFALQADDVCAPAGYIVAEHQFKIPKTAEKVRNLPTYSYTPQIIENAHKLSISGDDFRYIFNKKTGCFETLNLNGENILQGPIAIDLATNLEQISNKSGDKSAKIAKIFTRIYDLYYENANGYAILSLKISLNAAGIPPLAEVDATYKISPNGTIYAHYNAVFADDAPPINGFGLNINLPPNFNEVTYFGLGPNDCTATCHAAMYKAVFSQDLKSSYNQKSTEIYRHNCDWAAIKSDDYGLLILGNFDFAAHKSTQMSKIYTGFICKSLEKSMNFEIKLRPLPKPTANIEEMAIEMG